MAGRVLHVSDDHEHILIDEAYNSSWFGQTHACISKGGNVWLYQFDSTKQTAEVHLSEHAMEALVKAWQRRKASVGQAESAVLASEEV